MLAAFAKSKPGAFKAFSKSNGKGDGRKPQHQFPNDYAKDTMCRYCKSTEHLVPSCSKLYQKLENCEMPAALIQANNTAMEAARQH